MRSLHADLSAAQKDTKRRPYLYVQVQDRLAGVNRLRRTQWYAGAEADNGHAAIVAADGSLIRARFDGTTLYRSRVTNPTIGSDYSIWTSWVTAKANIVAFAKAGSTLWCIVVGNAINTQVYAATSADNGASWSAFSLRFTNDQIVAQLAAAGKSDGNVVVCVIPGPPTVGVKAYRWNGAAWTGYNGPAWPPAYNGVAVFYSGDWNVIVTDEDTAAAVPVKELRRYLFGDGYSQALNTWSAGVVIQSAITSSSITFAAPYAARPDTNRVTFRQQHTGDVAYNRIAHTQQPATSAFADDLWREPVPTAVSAPYGLAISYDATNVFLTTARYVFQSPAVPATLEITADVVSAHLHEHPLSPQLSEIVLDNSAGTYATPGSGAVAVLTKGADVIIGQGYQTASGPRYSAGPTYHVEAFEHTYEKGRATLRVVLGSPWTHLARHRFPRAVALAAGDDNIFQQLRYVAARVGYEFSSTGSSPASVNLYPPLTIQPGHSALTAFRTILERVPDHMVTLGVFLLMNEPLTADTADAAYKRPLSDGNQQISAATYRDALKEANHIQAFAGEDALIVAEDLDDTEAQLLYSAPRQRADPYIWTAAQATARAAREQREQVIGATRDDQLLAPVHCGVETNDVIAITDTRAGLTAAKRRVLTIETIYRRGPKGARYEHLMTLGAP